MIQHVKDIQNVNISGDDGRTIPYSAGYTTVAKFGRNTALTTIEDVVDQGGTIVYPSDTGTACFIKAAADSAATRGLSVEVAGLDADWAPQTWTGTLDGTDSTTETAIGTFSRVFRIKNTDSTVEDQNILIGPTGFASTYIQITAGNSQTLYGAYSIPAGKVAYIQHWGASINKAGSATDREATLELFVRPYGGVFQLKHVFGLGTAGSSIYEVTWNIPAPDGGISAKSDIKVRASATAASDISSWFEIEMITA